MTWIAATGWLLLTLAACLALVGLAFLLFPAKAGAADDDEPFGDWPRDPRRRP